MKNFSLSLISLAIIGALTAPDTLLAAGARKQAFASTAGADAANCGAADNPCRTIQYALDNILAGGGALYLQTPGDYQPATITTSVAIINASSGSAGVFKPRDGLDAIRIPATAPIAVKLRGLTLDGGGVSVSTSFSVDAGKSTVALTDCTVQNASRGFDIGGASGVHVGGYVAGGAFRNVDIGVNGRDTRDTLLAPFAIDSTSVSANLIGYRFGMITGVAVLTNSSAAAGGTGLDAVNITNQGGYIGAKTVVDRFSATGNRIGARVAGGGLLMSRSSILANTTGLQLDTTVYGAGPNQTFQNNIVAGNNADIAGSLPGLTPAALQ